MENILAESKNYKIVSEFEEVHLTFKNQKPNIIIGDFYGDPNCAIISKDEKFAVIAGCGLIIYRLEKPFDSYAYDKISEQYFEFKRTSKEIWWIDNLEQIDDHNFTFEIIKNSFSLLKKPKKSK